MDFIPKVKYKSDIACSQSPGEGAFSSQDSQLCMENLLELDPEVFEKDRTLFSELIKRLTDASNPLGCVLIAKNTKLCKVCGATLLLKKRESVGKFVVNDHEHVKYIGGYYIKFCRNRNCN